MKNRRLLKYLVSVMLVVYMLATACLPAAALAIEGATDTTSDLPSFTLSYEDGVLSLRLNAELLYEVVSDKQLTKEEIFSFLPEEIAALFENGQTPTVEDLRAVLVSHLSSDELRAMVNDLPIDLAKKLVDLEMITNLIQIDELVGLVDMEALLEGVSDEALLSLVEGEPLEMMLANEKIFNTVIENIDMQALLADGLMDDEKVSDEIKRQLEALLSDNGEGSKRDQLLNDILKEENQDLFEKLVTDELKKSLFADSELIEQLQKDNKINYSHLTQSDIEKLKSAGVLAIGEIKFSALATRIREENLLNYLNATSRTALAKAFFDKGYIDIDDIKGMEGVIDTSETAIDTLKENLAKKAVLGWLSSFESLEIDTNIDNWRTDEMVSIVEALIDAGALTYDELIDWGVIRTDNAAIEALKDLLAQKTVDTYFPNNTLDAAAIEALLANATFDLSYEELIACGVIRTDMNDPRVDKARMESLLKDKIGPQLLNEYMSKVLTEDDFLALEEAGLTYGDLIEWGVICTDMNDPAVNRVALTEVLERCLDAQTVIEFLAKDTLTQGDIEFLKSEGVSYDDLIACGIVRAKLTAMTDEHKNALKEKLAAKYAQDYFSGDLTASALEELKHLGFAYEDMIACGVIDTSSEAVSRLKRYLSDKISSNFVQEGINATLVGELLASGITYEELIACGVIPGINGSIDSAVIEKVKTNVAKKAFLAYFDFDVDGDWDEDTMVENFRAWIDDGLIAFSDVESVICYEKINPHAILTTVGTDNLVAYVQQTKGLGTDYTAFDIALDFYEMEKWSFDDLKAIGITIDVEKLTMGLIIETKLMDDATIKACLMDDKYIGPQKLVNALFAEDVKANTLSAIAGHVNVFKPYVDFDALVGVIGPQTLVSKVGFKNIVDALGGFEALLSTDPETGYFTQEELTQLIQLIGVDRVRGFLESSGILNALDMRALLSDALDILKSKGDQYNALLDEIRARALTMLNTDIVALYLNGEMIFSPDEDVADPGMPVGSFDLSQIVAILLRGLPDVGDFLDIPADGDIASYVFRMKVDRNQYPNAPEDGYTFGFTIGFMGNPEKLQGMVEEYRDLFDIKSITDELDIEVSAELPASFAVIYREALESDRLVHLRQLILEFPTMTLSEVADELDAFEPEEFEELANLLSERSESLRAKLAAALDKTGTLGARVEPRVERILDQVTTAEGLHAIFGKIAGKLRAVPGGSVRTLDSFYNVDENVFRFESEQSVDLYEKICRFVNLPEDVLMLFGSADGMTLRAQIVFDLGMEGIHRIETVTIAREEEPAPIQPMAAWSMRSNPTPLGHTRADDTPTVNTNVYYLSEGTDLSLLHDILDVSAFIDENGNPITTVPRESARVYSSEFESYVRQVTFDFGSYHTGQTPIAPLEISYMAGFDTIEEVLAALPEIPLDQLESGWLYYWGTEGMDIEDVWAMMRSLTPSNPSLAISLYRRRPEVKIYGTHEQSRALYATWKFVPGEENFADWKGEAPTDKLNALFFHPEEARYFNWQIVGAEPDLSLTQDFVLELNLSVKEYTVQFQYGGGLGAQGSATLKDALGLAADADLTNAVIGTADDKYLPNGVYDEANVPAVRGYSYRTEWPTALHFDDSQPIVVSVTYTLNTYHAYFYLDNVCRKDVSFNVEQTEAERMLLEPDMRAYLARGYVADWAGVTFPVDPLDQTELEDLHFYATSRRSHYLVTFVDENGATLAEIWYKPGEAAPDLSAIAALHPTNRTPVYTPVPNWNLPADESSDQTITVSFLVTTYTMVYRDADGRVIATVEYSPDYGTVDWQTPDWSALLDLSRPGYTYEIVGSPSTDDAVDGENNAKIGSITVTYTAIPYKVIFKHGNEILAELTYTVEDDALDPSEIPALPTLRGYTVAWSEYELTYGADVVVNVIETPITYYAILMVDGEEYDRIPFTVETTSITLPNVPAKIGYTGAWSAYTLPYYHDGEPDHITITADYTAIPYRVIFKYGTQILGQVTYTVEDDALNPAEIPALPALRGYTVAWSAYTLTYGADVTVNVIATPITYYAIFMANGQEIRRVPFTVETLSISHPDVPAKVGYTGAWSTYTLPYYHTNEPGNITVTAQYRLIEYFVIFMHGNQVLGEVTYTIEDAALDPNEVPELPSAKRGYTFAWSEYELTYGEDVVVNVIETPITYYAIFMANGQELARVPFTVETQQITAPGIPARTGYAGSWSTYILPYYHSEAPTNLTITPLYTPLRYTATFIADGKVVATVSFTVEDTVLNVPVVPAKAGFTGAWEEYTIGASDMVIYAVYTPLDGTDTTSPSDTAPTDKPSDDVPGGDDDESGCKMWGLWVILAVLCVGGATFAVLFLLKNRDDDDDDTPTPPVEPDPICEDEVEPELEVEMEEPVVIRPEPAPAPTHIAPITARYARSSAQRAIVNLGTLNEAFEDGALVTLEVLKARGVVSAKNKTLKILATGTLTKALTVEAEDFSGSAKALIEAAGGTAIEKH